MNADRRESEKAKRFQRIFQCRFYPNKLESLRVGKVGQIRVHPRLSVANLPFDSFSNSVNEVRQQSVSRALQVWTVRRDS
jgi:hypothetical protein